MKKNLLFLMCVPMILLSAASDKSRRSISRSPFEVAAYTPASVFFTAISAGGHNALTVINAQGYVGDSQELSPLSFTIPAGKKSSDEGVCKGRLRIEIPFTDQVLTEELLRTLKPDLDTFHIRSGNDRVYMYKNFRNLVAALKLSKDSTRFESFKPLLAPWEAERLGELAYGHEGKIEVRMPGSLTKSVRSQKSKPVGKK